jgi:ribose transport system ATP-binding protein
VVINRLTPLLEARQVTKRFPGVTALRQVGLTLARGEVLAVIGENGAGKSTLMKILAGIQQPDEGEIFMDGEPTAIDSVHTALHRGIALIHQELNLAANLSVGANIYLGREPRRWGMIDSNQIHQDARLVLGKVGLSVDPRVVAGQLSIGRQQLVEIARALSVGARVLIMDEPTSSLSQQETETLFDVVRQLRDDGVSIIYISHRLGEVRELADRVTVLRDGELAGELPRDEIDHDRMVRLMVGRDISQLHVRQPRTPGAEAIAVEGVVVPGRPQHRLSFAVRAGEIVGVAGLVGAGRTELLQVLFGVVPAVAGTICVAGKKIKPRSPFDAMSAGIALVPEDRKSQGLILQMAVKTNISLASVYQQRCAGVLLNDAFERRETARMIDRLRIKTPSDQQPVQYLSGGNQQKVVLGKWLSLEPRVLLLDEPTRGVDVGAKQEIYQLMEELAGKGVAILFVSSEMEEILRMSDRTLVMHEGAIMGELSRDQLSEERVMQLATGLRQLSKTGLEQET